MRIVKCGSCGAQTVSPCQFCGWIDPGEQQRQLDEQVASIRQWDTPRYYVRSGALNSGPFTARQIQALAAEGKHHLQISDNGAPFVMIVHSPFAAYLPEPKTNWRTMGVIGIVLVVLVFGFSGCMFCTAIAGSV